MEYIKINNPNVVAYIKEQCQIKLVELSKKHKDLDDEYYNLKTEYNNYNWLKTTLVQVANRGIMTKLINLEGQKYRTDQMIRQILNIYNTKTSRINLFQEDANLLGLDELWDKTTKYQE